MCEFICWTMSHRMLSSLYWSVIHYRGGGAFDCLSGCRPERCFIPVQFLFLPPSAYVESLHLLISVLQRQLLLFVSGALFISMMLLLSGNKHGLHEEGDSLTLAEDSLETSSLIFPEKQ